MGFLLLFQRLCAHTKHFDTKLLQLGVGIAKGTCLRGASPGSGYVIPADEGRAIGTTQHGVEINNQCARISAEINGLSCGASQGDRR